MLSQNYNSKIYHDLKYEKRKRPKKPININRNFNYYSESGTGYDTILSLASTQMPTNENSKTLGSIMAYGSFRNRVITAKPRLRNKYNHKEKIVTLTIPNRPATSTISSGDKKFSTKRGIDIEMEMLENKMQNKTAEKRVQTATFRNRRKGYNDYYTSNFTHFNSSSNSQNKFHSTTTFRERCENIIFSKSPQKQKQVQNLYKSPICDVAFDNILNTISRGIAYINQKNKVLYQEKVMNLLEREAGEISRNVDKNLEAFCAIKNYSLMLNNNPQANIEMLNDLILNPENEIFLIPFITKIIQPYSVKTFVQNVHEQNLSSDEITETTNRDYNLQKKISLNELEKNQADTNRRRRRMVDYDEIDETESKDDNAYIDNVFLNFVEESEPENVIKNLTRKDRRSRTHVNFLCDLKNNLRRSIRDDSSKKTASLDTSLRQIITNHFIKEQTKHYEKVTEREKEKKQKRQLEKEISDIRTRVFKQRPSKGNLSTMIKRFTVDHKVTPYGDYFNKFNLILASSDDKKKDDELSAPNERDEDSEKLYTDRTHKTSLGLSSGKMSSKRSVGSSFKNSVKPSGLASPLDSNKNIPRVSDINNVSKKSSDRNIIKSINKKFHKSVTRFESSQKNKLKVNFHRGLTKKRTVKKDKAYANSSFKSGTSNEIKGEHPEEIKEEEPNIIKRKEFPKSERSNSLQRKKSIKLDKKKKKYPEYHPQLSSKSLKLPLVKNSPSSKKSSFKVSHLKQYGSQMMNREGSVFGMSSTFVRNSEMGHQVSFVSVKNSRGSLKREQYSLKEKQQVSVSPSSMSLESFVEPEKEKIKFEINTDISELKRKVQALKDQDMNEYVDDVKNNCALTTEKEIKTAMQLETQERIREFIESLRRHLRKQEELRTLLSNECLPKDYVDIATANETVTLIKDDFYKTK